MTRRCGSGCARPGERTTPGLLASRFVVVHADADVRWSERPSRHESSFRDDVLPLVKSALAPESPSPRRPGQPRRAQPARPEDEVERYVRNVALIMPYYTIESWTYQNTAVAIRLCREKHQGRDVEKFQKWQDERAGLDDEIEEIKNVHLQKKHNLELASAGYPARAVYEARASFHAAVETLRGCEDLRAALGEAPAGQ